MSNQQLELYIESYLRPYKKNQEYQEQKRILLNKSNDIVDELQKRGINEQDIYIRVKEKIESGDLDVDISKLSIDENNKIEYSKKLFTNKNIEELPFINTLYRWCDFKESVAQEKEISHSFFVKCYMEKLNVSHCTLSNTTFKKNDCSNINFDYCKIIDSFFHESHLPKASFANTTLTNVTFEDCYLRKVSFTNSFLVNVQFKYSTLSKLDFTGATMDKETYRLLEDEGADLTGVKIL